MKIHDMVDLNAGQIRVLAEARRRLTELQALDVKAQENNLTMH